MRNLHITVLVVLAMGVGAAATWLTLRPRDDAPLPIREAKPTGSVESPRPSAILPILSTVNKTEADQNANLTLNVEYPEVVFPTRQEVADQTSDVIARFVTDRIEEFRRAAFEDAIDSSGIPSTQGSDLVMRWRPMLVSPALLAIRFDMSAYIGGAAHPDNRVHVLLYDLDRKVLLRTSDLFQEQGAALTYLSKETRRLLRPLFSDLSDADFVAAVSGGTEPSAENFARVAPVQDGLVIIFDPYQVAPYARGAPEVRIPLGELGSVLHPKIIDAMRAAKEGYVEAVPIGE
jgi:hypothetical protein